MAPLLSQTWFIILMGITLIGAVLSAVHHAEVIAHKTGEPYGTLVLSISVTIIEVSLIIAMMLAGSKKNALPTTLLHCKGIRCICIYATH
jgi:Ca2+:H+ antiporter